MSDLDGNSICLSRSLEALLRDHLDDTQKDLVFKRLDHHIKKYKALKERNPKRVAEYFQISMDQRLDQQMEKQKDLSAKISCKAGCHECCKQVVTITRDEAVLLREVIEDLGIQIDVNRLLKQVDANSRTWYQLEGKDRECVFLDEGGQCKVYNWRPLYCRKHLSLDEPALCNKEDSRHPRMYIDPEAEIIASAATSSTESGPMARLLLDEIESQASIGPSPEKTIR